MPSRRTLLQTLAAGGTAVLAGCESNGPTPGPRDAAAFAAADRSTETSTHVVSRAPDESPLLTERGIGTTPEDPDPDDHWTFLDTSSHLAELGDADRGERTPALLETVDLTRAFVFVYQVQNRIPESVIEVVETGTYRDRFYFHLAWDDDVARLSTPTVKTCFAVVPGELPSRPVVKVTYSLGREW